MALAEELSARGVCVARGTAPPELCAKIHAEALEACARFEALPMSMAERRRGNTHRVFLPVDHKRSAGASGGAAATARYDFKLPMSPALRKALGTILSGPVGSAIAECLGEDSTLTGLLFIVSEKGAAAQAVHSDGDWGANVPKIITMFVAPADIQDENMGPTRFFPATHKPSCFDGGQWIPPTPTSVSGREDAWFPLRAGDTVMMESTLYHAGGANTSEKKRVLLSFSFTQPASRGGNDGAGPGSQDCWTLRDFRGSLQ